MSNLYEKEWRKEIKGRPFFDWGILWKREKSRRSMVGKYVKKGWPKKPPRMEKCEQCGGEYAPDRRGTKFCSLRCVGDSQSDPLSSGWGQCAVCHAAVGFGLRTSARILRVARFKSVSKELAKRGARRSAKERWAARGQSKAIIDPIDRIKRNLRRKLRDMMSNPSGKKYKDVFGCSTSELRGHIESQFTRRMSWENYGESWHVDHIMPVAAFDHTQPHQVRQCWHFTNLRPLCAVENRAKRDKITRPQMELTLNVA